jgi:hypothetical protein
MPYEQRLLKCDLLPLSYRREILDSVFLYNNIHELNTCALNSIKFYSNNMYTRNVNHDELCIVKNRIHLNCYEQFFTNSIRDVWNSLPLTIRDCDLSDSGKSYPFKKEVKNHFQHLLVTKFDANDCCTWVSKCTCPRCNYF